MIKITLFGSGYAGLGVDQRLRRVIHTVGVTHPEVFLALLVNAGDVADGQVGDAGQSGEPKRDLPVAAAALGAGGAEEQTLALSADYSPRSGFVRSQGRSVA